MALTDPPKRWDRTVAVAPEKIDGFEDMMFLFNFKGAKTNGFIWMNCDEAACLWRWVRKAPPGTSIVEVGRAEGGSTVLIAAARRDQETVITSIDTGPVNDRQLATLLGELGLANVELLVANSQTFDTGRVGPVGLVFIDAEHTYRGVKNDFENWLPAVVPGGFVVLHDVRDSGLQNYGPLQLHEELLNDGRVEQVAAADSVRVMRKR